VIVNYFTRAQTMDGNLKKGKYLLRYHCMFDAYDIRGISNEDDVLPINMKEFERIVNEFNKVHSETPDKLIERRDKLIASIKKVKKYIGEKTTEASHVKMLAAISVVIDPIYECDFMYIWPKGKDKVKKCKGCGKGCKESKILLCPCRLARYCGKECQKNDRESHRCLCKATCTRIKEMGEEGTVWEVAVTYKEVRV
jgi:hypothetical protein